MARRSRAQRLSHLVGLVLLALAGGASASGLAIVDTHLHGKREAWDPYTPEAVLAILDRTGVRGAFVSSTLDDGTLRLHRLASRVYRGIGEVHLSRGEASSERFMVGRDTWAPSRWTELPGVQEMTRAWLRQLPPGVAERIASGLATGAR